MSKKKREVTLWYPPGIKPIRPGVYERRILFGSAWSYWDGKSWGFSCNSVSQAYRAKSIQSKWQRSHWRGLAQDPNKA